MASIHYPVKSFPPEIFISTLGPGRTSLVEKCSRNSSSTYVYLKSRFVIAIDLTHKPKRNLAKIYSHEISPLRMILNPKVIYNRFAIFLLEDFILTEKELLFTFSIRMGDIEKDLEKLLPEEEGAIFLLHELVVDLIKESAKYSNRIKNDDELNSFIASVALVKKAITLRIIKSSGLPSRKQRCLAR